MASTTAKRPLPALIALLALLVLSGLVWWRVINRGTATSSSAAHTPCPTTHSAASVVLPSPATVTVAVLNATKRNGIGATARSALVTDGFQVPKAAANDRPATVAETAEIRYGPAARQAATLLRYYFPGARMVPNEGTTSTVVVSLGTKYRTVASATAVRAALEGDHVEVATVASAAGSTGASPSC